MQMRKKIFAKISGRRFLKWHAGNMIRGKPK
jgi:hypothetical protein